MVILEAPTTCNNHHNQKHLQVVSARAKYLASVLDCRTIDCTFLIEPRDK
jgi:hypothetical protein